MSFRRSRYAVASSKIFNYAMHGVRIGCQALDQGFQSVIKLHAQLTYYVLPIMAQLIYWDISAVVTRLKHPTLLTPHWCFHPHFKEISHHDLGDIHSSG